MPWNNVRDALLTEVVPLMRPEDRPKGERWVELLAVTENGPRLGACIAIDIKGAVEAKVFASILEHLDFTKEDAQKNACWAFDDAVRNHPDNRDLPDKSHFICRSCFVADHLGDTDMAYVRVLDLSGFITYMLKPSGATLASLDPEDVSFARDAYFAEEDDEGEWEDIEREWSGTMGRIFVTSLSEINNLVSGAPDPVGTLNDALGLGYTPPVEFVAVKYPEGFREPCHQPTTLDVCWANMNWYISHKNIDLWGRTHSCSGAGRNARERVHRKLTTLSGGFSGRRIGELKGGLAADLQRLQDEAFKRV